MYLLIILFPLLSSAFCGLFGRLLGKIGTTIVAFTLMFLTLCLSYLAFFEVCLSRSPCYIESFYWFFFEGSTDPLKLYWGFYFDSLTCTMLIVVNTVSFLVHFYSSVYMENDPHYSRFFSYLSLFTFFMLMLVTSNNLIQLFLGWEGVGLCSYLLINFWFTRIQANKAAIKAMVLNRIGDLALSLAIFLNFALFGTFNFSVIFSTVSLEIFTIFEVFGVMVLQYLDVIGILFAIGAAGKSAQIGLHTWLPDAMEGPTPVSALIHAATMVTAGVFLIIRFSPLYEYSTIALSFVTLLGAVTSFFAATTGLFQNDLKRVIAYSTCSQLGYMVFACGVSGYSAAAFHLYNHAFFKALLFLTAGCIIHSLNDEQDMRKMGGLLKILPLSYCMMLIGSLALIGFPFLSGFYSKDLILELSFAHFSVLGHFAFWLGTLAAFFTAFYSFRLIYLTFLTRTNAYKNVIENAHESNLKMAAPLMILAVFSIFIGFLSKDLMVGLGTDFWNNAIFVHPTRTNILDIEFIPFYIKILPTVLSLIGAGSSILFYSTFNKKAFEFLNDFEEARFIYIFFNRKWLFDKIYNDFLSQVFLKLCFNFTYKSIDRGIIEILGAIGLYKVTQGFSSIISNIQTGYIYHYTAFLSGSFCLILILAIL